MQIPRAMRATALPRLPIILRGLACSFAPAACWVMDRNGTRRIISSAAMTVRVQVYFGGIREAPVALGGQATGTTDDPSGAFPRLRSADRHQQSLRRRRRTASNGTTFTAHRAGSK